MSWWSDNWDKVATVGVGSVIAAIAGFYSGISAVQSDISALRERAARLESEVVNLKPLNATVQEISKKQVDIEFNHKALKQRADISVETRQLLSLRLEQARKETIIELRGLLNDKK